MGGQTLQRIWPLISFMTRKTYIIHLIVIFLCPILSSCGQQESKESILRRQKELIVAGQKLYLNHGCAVCHGKEGYGDGLAAERFNPKPIDLHNPKAYLQGNSVKAIKKSIKYGIRMRNSAMPKYDHLTDKELSCLGGYLKSLQMNK